MKLKDLKWKNIADKRWEANTVFGTYWIRRWLRAMMCISPLLAFIKGFMLRLKRPKNVAKEDLLERILSCIENETDN